MKTITVEVKQLLSIFVISLVLGLIKYGSLTSEYIGESWQIKFIELWNDFFNYFLTGIVGYYFIRVRWPLLSSGTEVSISDFFLFIIFTLGIFGHLCVMSNNITNGVETILKKLLERK